MERLIVDGYNIIHAWPSLKRLLGVSLEAARDKLVERLSVYALVTGPDVTLAFEVIAPRPGDDGPGGHVRGAPQLPSRRPPHAPPGRGGRTRRSRGGGPAGGDPRRPPGPEYSHGPAGFRVHAPGQRPSGRARGRAAERRRRDRGEPSRAR